MTGITTSRESDRSNNHLASKPWVWVMGGIIIVGMFFYFFQSLIIFVGGTALGLYMFRTYGPIDSTRQNDYDIFGVLFQGAPLENTLQTMKEWFGVFWPTQPPPEPETRENFWPTYGRWSRLVRKD